MDGPRDDHTKWSKSERERQISYDVAYMWNLKKMVPIHETDSQIQKKNLQLPVGKSGVEEIN